MDTEDGVEVVWNEVRYSSRKSVSASKVCKFTHITPSLLSFSSSLFPSLTLTLLCFLYSLPLSFHLPTSLSSPVPPSLPPPSPLLSAQEALVKILRRLTDMQHPNIVNFMEFWHDRVDGIHDRVR